MFDKVRETQRKRADQNAARRDTDQKRIEVVYEPGTQVGMWEPESIANRLDYRGRGRYDKTIKHARKSWKFKWTGPHSILGPTVNTNVYSILHNVRGKMTTNVNKLKSWPSSELSKSIAGTKRFKPPFADLPQPCTEVQQGEIVVLYVPQASGRCRVAKIIEVVNQTDLIVQWYGYFKHQKVLDDVLLQHRWEPLWFHPVDGLTYSKEYPLRSNHNKHTNLDFPIIPLKHIDVILRNVCLKPNGLIPKTQAVQANLNLRALVQEREHENFFPPQAAEIFMTGKAYTYLSCKP